MKELHSNIRGREVSKYGQVSRKEKNSWSVVFRSPKDYEAAVAALRSRLTLRLAQLVELLFMEQRVIGSSPITYIMDRYIKTQSLLRYYVKGA